MSALVFGALASCASDGRDLAEAQPWQTTTTRPAPPTSAPPQLEGLDGLTLSSPDFEPGDPAPLAQTCAGANQAPELEWSNVPDDAAELAITLADQTDPAKPLLLWLVAGIDPSTTSLDGANLAEGVATALNDYGQSGWGNPCIETLKEGVLDLQFKLHVLTEPSGILDSDPGNEAWATLSAAAVDSATVLMKIDAAP